MFCWSLFQLFYLNEKKRLRIAVSPLLPTRPRGPWVMESGASIIANIVLEAIEARVIQKFNFKPIINTRYVDDIFTIIPTDQIREFVDVFNSVEDLKKFTSNTEVHKILNYLNLSLRKNENVNVRTNRYKKITFSGQYLNYNFHHPFAQKTGCIKNCINRGIKLSDVQFRKKNWNQIIEVLILNSYPLPFINSLVREIINEIYNSSIKNKRKEKWLENFNKNDKKTYTSLQQWAFGKNQKCFKKNENKCFFFQKVP